MISKYGGQRGSQESRFDLIPFEALDVAGKIFALGEERYGRHPEEPSRPNWTGLDLSTEQSPLSHALKHLYRYAAGDESEDNLGAALCNIAMLVWFRDNPSSNYYGLRYPEILGGGTDDFAAVDESSTGTNGAFASFIRSLLGTNDEQK